MEKKIMYSIAAVVVVILVIGGFVWFSKNSQPGRLDDFAKCIASKGAKFYGAFWCPHCQNQKGLFGGSKQYLPYIECSTPDSNGQLPVCNQEKIQVYPTWKFADGTVKEGELSLQDLADATGCSLPK